jgi:mannose-6-phosphate isomerase-like protein (cupin superfamily)
VADSAKPVRRIVCIDDEAGRSAAIADGPAPDVRTDPARPGFASTYIWSTDRTPARIEGVRTAPPEPPGLAPLPGGSVCRVVTFPPDEVFAQVGARDVENWFRTMGAPQASTYAAGGPHPYMQRTETLDFCLVLEGEITLVLDTEEVQLSAGDTVIQRGTNHAWSNRSGRPCVIAISSHDGTFEAE